METRLHLPCVMVMTSLHIAQAEASHDEQLAIQAPFGLVKMALQSGTVTVWLSILEGPNLKPPFSRGSSLLEVATTSEGH